MSDLLCEKHKISLECMGGCSAHRDNWYCPECDKEAETKRQLDQQYKDIGKHGRNCNCYFCDPRV